MKTIGRVLIICVVMISCSKPDNVKTGNPNNMSSFAKKFLGMNSSSNASGLSSSFYNTSSNSAMAPSIPTLSSTDSTKSDTTIVGTPGGNCANTLYITHSDGSMTYITDYGNGCTVTYNNCSTHYFGKSISTS